MKAEPKALYRSDSRKLLAGVTSGIAEFVGIDPTIVRIIFIITAILGGSGIIVYLAFWLLIPKKTDKAIDPVVAIKHNVKELVDEGKVMVAKVKRYAHKKTSPKAKK